MPDDWVLSVFQGERECNELHGVWGSKVARACNEDSRKGARKENEIQFGFMSGKGMVDAVFILRLLEE